ncbi:hypothetical protein [Acidiplasma sp. MBA-1]|uniref:hypothetical protein n=1 Tax=Acidiplasma sp. MBA-1 TaxID=1293648 RepID=UPI0005DEA7BD|nr:hypothetical protein [Acidiplasma sp. MBA-1]KJE48524.1 hypothetical protein TZ01_09045 [Acidiplasma sp. MBA-1]
MGELILSYEKKNNPSIKNVKTVKKFFSSSAKNIFSLTVKQQSRYSSGNIIHTIRNAISSKEYIETYVRNSNCNHIPSDSIQEDQEYCIRIGSHKRSGSENLKRHTVHDGITGSSWS